MENTTDTAMDFFMANRSLSTFQMMVAYANSVRPEVVVPKKKRPIEPGLMICTGWNECLRELRRLNPTLAFTELNHEK